MSLRSLFSLFLSVRFAQVLLYHQFLIIKKAFQSAPFMAACFACESLSLVNTVYFPNVQLVNR